MAKLEHIPTDDLELDELGDAGKKLAAEIASGVVTVRVLWRGKPVGTATVTPAAQPNAPAGKYDALLETAPGVGPTPEEWFGDNLVFDEDAVEDALRDAKTKWQPRLEAQLNDKA